MLVTHARFVRGMKDEWLHKEEEKAFERLVGGPEALLALYSQPVNA